jgi:hypothetical protein
MRRFELILLKTDGSALFVLSCHLEVVLKYTIG